MPALFPLDNLLGAAFIGLILSSVIFGITCLQLYLYFTEYVAEDRIPMRLFVSFLMILDTLHVALITHTMYFYLVTNFGDYVRLQRIVWSLEIQVVVADLVAAAVQGFFAWRIYVLSGRKNWWIPLFVILCACGLLASSIGFMVFGFKFQFFADTRFNIPWTIAGLTCELIGDTVMTVSMTYYLMRARTSFERTNRAINLLVTYTLNTGLVTTIVTIFNLAMFVAYEKTMIYTPFFFVLARLYSCSFMSTLNSRKNIRAHVSSATRHTTAQDSYMLSNIGAETEQIVSKPRFMPAHAQVYVSSTKEMM